MARSVDIFYAGATPPLPIGVLPYDEELTDDETAGTGGTA